MIIEAHGARLKTNGLHTTLDRVKPGHVAWCDDDGNWRLGYVAEICLGVSHTQRVLFDEDSNQIDPPEPDPQRAATFLHPVVMEVKR